MTRPLWRSLMYVPTHVEKFVGSAHTRGADAIILDLEDAVPPDAKVRARGLVESAARQVGRGGADVLVRDGQQGTTEKAAAVVLAKGDHPLFLVHGFFPRLGKLGLDKVHEAKQAGLGREKLRGKFKAVCRPTRIAWMRQCNVRRVIPDVGCGKQIRAQRPECRAAIDARIEASVQAATAGKA